jgi:hypothetical protein
LIILSSFELSIHCRVGIPHSATFTAVNQLECTVGLFLVGAAGHRCLSRGDSRRQDNKSQISGLNDP